MSYSPWADAARRHPDVHIERWDTAPVNGVWVKSEKVILLNRELDWIGRRCTLAHELAHIDLNHEELDDQWFSRRQEREAAHLAAVRLLADVEEIAAAMCAFPLDPPLVAEQLGVTVEVLTARLRTLTDSERRYIEHRVAAQEIGV